MNYCFMLDFFYYVCECFAFMYVCTPCPDLIFTEVRETIGFLWTGDTDSFKLLCEGWKLNSGILEQVLGGKISFQPQQTTLKTRNNYKIK